MHRLIVRKKTQRGAIMLASLVFLAAMSIVAISTMESSMLDEKMSANTQNYTAAFNAAETALEEAMNNAPAMNTALTRGVNPQVPATVAVSYPQTSKTVANATLELMSDKPIKCPNTSGLECIYFRAIGNGLLRNSAWRAINEQGFYRKVPAYNSVNYGS